MAALDRTPGIQVRALKLIAARRISAAAEKVFDRLDSTAGGPQRRDRGAGRDLHDAGFRPALHAARQGVRKEVGPLSGGAENALAAQEPDARYARVAEHLKSAPEKTRYYPLLAFAGTRQAIDDLLAASDPEAAFQALLTVDNPSMLDVLHELARQNPPLDRCRHRALCRLRRHSRAGPTGRVLPQRARSPTRSTGPNKLLRALAQTGSLPALNIAAAYLDDPATGESAAYAVKSIAARNPGMGGESVVDALEKARTIYADSQKTTPMPDMPSTRSRDCWRAMPPSRGLNSRKTRRRRVSNSLRRALARKVDRKQDQLRPAGGHDLRHGTVRRQREPLYRQEYGDFVLRFEFSFVREA